MLMKGSPIRSLLLAAGLSVGASSVAHADFNFGNTLNNTGAVCGGTNFATCASASIDWTSANTAVVTVTNWGGNGEVFAAVGITNLPNGVTYTVTYTSNDPTSSWAKGTQGLSGDPILQQTAGITAQGNGGSRVTNALGYGYTLTATFTFSQGLVNPNLQSSQAPYGVAVHAISGPAPCGSTKIVFNGSGGQLSTSSSGPSGCYTVPEPATMTLLTTGLLGLGGAGFLKRRKKA